MGFSQYQIFKINIKMKIITKKITSMHLEHQIDQLNLHCSPASLHMQVLQVSQSHS